MNRFLALIAVGGAAVLLTGCAPSPKQYESEPVKVSTSQGVVTCQLYRRDMVVWDRAIDRPNSMSVQQADQVCLAEGTRLKNES